jgi:hypothetical protein
VCRAHVPTVNLRQAGDGHCLTTPQAQPPKRVCVCVCAWHATLQGKTLPYEEDIRVPFYIRGPGIPAGLVSSYMVRGPSRSAPVSCREATALPAPDCAMLGCVVFLCVISSSATPFCDGRHAGRQPSHPARRNPQGLRNTHNAQSLQVLVSSSAFVMLSQATMVDVTSTLVQLAGGSPPDRLDGIPLPLDRLVAGGPAGDGGYVAAPGGWLWGQAGGWLWGQAGGWLWGQAGGGAWEGAWAACV